MGLQVTNEFQHFWQGSLEIHSGDDLSHLGARQLPGDDQRDARYPQAGLGEKFLKIEIPGNSRQMSIQIAGVFEFTDEFDILQRHIGSQVEYTYTMAFQQVVHIEQPQFMMLAFGQEQQYRRTGLFTGTGAFDANDQFLADDIGYQVLLSRVDMIAQPKNTDAIEKRENQLAHRLLDPIGQHIVIQNPLELFDIQVDHENDQVIDELLLTSGLIGKRTVSYTHLRA